MEERAEPDGDGVVLAVHHEVVPEALESLGLVLRGVQADALHLLGGDALLSTSTSTTAAATRVAQNPFHGLGASSHRALNDLNRRPILGVGLGGAAGGRGGVRAAHHGGARETMRRERGRGRESARGEARARRGSFARDHRRPRARRRRTSRGRRRDATGERREGDARRRHDDASAGGGATARGARRGVRGRGTTKLVTCAPAPSALIMIQTRPSPDADDPSCRSSRRGRGRGRRASRLLPHRPRPRGASSMRPSRCSRVTSSCSP